MQAEEGYWQGELEADTTSNPITFTICTFWEADPERTCQARKLRTPSATRRWRLVHLSWRASELNATCQSIFRLEAGGRLHGARIWCKRGETVHLLGGLEHTNSYVRFYLALIGAVGWELVPSIPPEFMLLPNWFYLIFTRCLPGRAAS